MKYIQHDVVSEKTRARDGKQQPDKQNDKNERRMMPGKSVNMYEFEYKILYEIFVL